MKIIVFSDSHGRYETLEKVYQMHPNADLYLHLGDGERDFDKLIDAHPQIKYIHVAGNCDFASFSPDFEVILAPGGHKIYAEHGYLSGVKSGYGRIKQTAKAKGCDIVFFGHTHIPHYEYDDGMWVANPGSAREWCYAIADITEKGVLISLTEVY